MGVNKLLEIVNIYREGKLAHAYLIETNNQDLCLQDLLNVIKQILCEREYKENCKQCNLCNLIKQKNLPTLKIIEPDGASIKKGQIQELKDSFSHKPIYSNKNIYIIKNSEKLNVASANTMLKFLEEPDGQVLGFFITNNKENILLTIQSRCQHLKVIYEAKKKDLLISLTDEQKQEFNELLNKYLKDIEENNELCILNNKKIVMDKLLKLVDISELLKIILDIYQNALYYKIGKKSMIDNFKTYIFLLNNSSTVLLKKVNILIKIVNNSNYNLNTQLLLDKMVLEMSGING